MYGWKVFRRNGEERFFDDREDAAEFIYSDDMCDQYQFDDFLDETYDRVYIAGVEFYPSNILREMDSCAYDTAYSDWCDDQRDGIINDIMCDLRRMSDGEEYHINDCLIVFYDNEDDEPEEIEFDEEEP